MDSEMSLGQWIVTIILSMIPCVGLVMLIIWAVSSNNQTRKTWAQAYLIVSVAVFVISFVIYMAFGAAILSAYAPYMSSMIF